MEIVIYGGLLGSYDIRVISQRLTHETSGSLCTKARYAPLLGSTSRWSRVLSQVTGPGAISSLHSDLSTLPVRLLLLLIFCYPFLAMDHNWLWLSSLETFWVNSQSREQFESLPTLSFVSSKGSLWTVPSDYHFPTPVPTNIPASFILWRGFRIHILERSSYCPCVAVL